LFFTFALPWVIHFMKDPNRFTKWTEQ
jgi:hypothetical protein